MWTRRSFTDSAPTARWERTRTRLKSSARKPTATSRATLFTTLKNRGRSRSCTCVPARPIRSAYLITSAKFVACHQFEFVDKIDVLEHAAPGAVFLLNAPAAPHGVWERLPREVQQQMIEKGIRFFAIDAYAVAKETGMGSRINTIMQTCYFAISGVLPREEAIAKIKKAVEKTYGKMGADMVRRNFEAVDHTLAHLHEIPVPGAVSAIRNRPPLVSEKAPDFVQRSLQ